MPATQCSGHHDAASASQLNEGYKVSLCIRCGESFSAVRSSLGYRHCLQCGDALAVSARRSWTVVPMNKSNYILVTEPELLKQLNPKRGGM